MAARKARVAQTWQMIRAMAAFNRYVALEERAESGTLTAAESAEIEELSAWLMRRRVGWERQTGEAKSPPG